MTQSKQAAKNAHREQTKESLRQEEKSGTLFTLYKPEKRMRRGAVKH